MTRLAAIACVTVISGLIARAQEPKPALTELEGSWRETIEANEKGVHRLAVSFAGESFTVLLADQLLQGTFAIIHSEKATSITLTIRSVNGVVVTEPITREGAFLLESGRLSLRLEQPVVPAAMRVISPPNLRIDPSDEKDPRRMLERLAEIQKEMAEFQKAHAARMDAIWREQSLLRPAPVSFRLEPVKK